MINIKSITRILGGVNWIKTIYFNFHYLSIKDAFKLPIFIFKHTKLSEMQGNVIVNGKMKMGRVKIGQYAVGTLDISYNRTIWQNNGTVVFKGKAHIGSGSKLSITNGGVLVFGNDFCVTGGSQIICSKEIVFGKENLLSWDILIMDTDFHNIINADGKIINSPKPIKIGDRVWIGCRTLILKGVNINNDVVVGAGSKITKDIITTNCIVAGTNNNVIKNNIQWRL